MKLKKTLRFLKKNYFLVIFFAAILFVGVVVGYKLLLSKPVYVYAKVKVGQGLWWVQTQKPSIWQVEGIKKGDISYGILGSPEAKILSKRYYRFYGSDQYDIYLTILLKVGLNKKTGQYTFNRAVISIGSPVEIQFSKAEVSGTIIALSQKPFERNLVEKVITLTKRYAFPWEVDAISVGDIYFDGEENIFEVLDKAALNTSSLSFDPYWNSGIGITEQTRYITVKAKVKLKKVENQWILGEDQLIVPGRNISISTPNFVFESYIVSDIR